MTGQSTLVTSPDDSRVVSTARGSVEVGASGEGYPIFVLHGGLAGTISN